MKNELSCHGNVAVRDWVVCWKVERGVNGDWDYWYAPELCSVFF